MNKLAAFVTVIATAVLVSLTMVGEKADRPRVFETFTSIDEATTELVLTYQCFKHPLETALKELKEEKISLAEATASVHWAASRNCPIYLDSVKVSDPGKTLQECIARNLIDHLRGCVDFEPELAARVKSLEIELEELLRQIDRAATEHSKRSAGRPPVVTVD